jgi:hypothetical protein
MTRKARSDSAKSAIDAAIAAASPMPDKPKHVKLRDGDQAFWLDIIRARARDEWTEADLIVAAQLARTMADIESESEKLDGEGSVIENARGTPVMNPRHSVLEQLARREMALMRSLQITGTAKGDKRELANKRELERGARKAREELSGNELLAT